MNRALAEFCASPLEYDLHEMVDDEDMLEMAKDCDCLLYTSRCV